MTAIDLLNALKAYTEDKVKDMRLITRVPENGTDPGERPPLVFIGNLPNKEQEKKAAPYILLKLLTKKVDDEVCFRSGFYRYTAYYLRYIFGG